MKKIFSTLAIVLCLFAALNAQVVPNYYWNGTTTTGSTLVGGAGTWTANTPANWLTAPTSGSNVGWPNTTAYNAVFSGTAGNVSVTATTIADTSFFTTAGYAIIASGATEQLQSNIILQGNGTTLTLNGAYNLEINGQVWATGLNDSLILAGQNQVGVANYYEVVPFGAGDTIGVNTAIYLPTAANDTVNVGYSTKVAGAVINGNINLEGVVGSGRAMFGCTSGNSVIYNGIIGGTGDIAYASGNTGGAGTVTLANTGNNFTGNLYMMGATSGDFQASNGNGACVPAGMKVYYNTAGQGGVFDINGSNVTIAGLLENPGTAAVGGVSNGGAPATLTINQSVNSSFGLVISNGNATNTLALTKSGSGALTLTAAETYTGATNINGGALFVNGSLASGSAVTVGSGGTLGGNGTAAGTLAVSSGGTVQAGSTSTIPGTLTTGAQTWTGGSSLNTYFAAVTGAAGASTTWGLVSSAGAVTLPASGNVSLNISGGTGFSNTTAYAWKILSGTSISNGTHIVLGTVGGSFAGYTGSFSIQATSTEVDLIYIPSGTPSLIATPGSLTGFVGQFGIGSSSQIYTLYGYNLTNGQTITVTPPANFQVSTDNATWHTNSSPLVLNVTGASLQQVIYVQVTSSAPLGALSAANITNVGSGGGSTNVSVSGAVYAPVPTTQATAITFPAVASTTMTVSWTPGNGSSELVTIRLTSNTNYPPSNGTTYTANLAYGSGGTTGALNYVVYSGAATGGPITITGLQAGNSYTIEVYDFNGNTGNQDYLTTTATGNPATQLTNPTYYWWNGAAGTAGGTTANGGAGTWNTTGSNHDWVNGTYSSNTGTAVAWANSNYNAVIAGTAGTGAITLNNTATPDSLIVKVTGYTISDGGNNINSAICLGQGVNLGLTVTGGNTVNLGGNISQYWNTTGASFTTSSSYNAPGYDQLSLANGTVISVPVTINNTGTAGYSITTASGGTATINGTVTLNATSGNGDIVLEGTGANSLMTINGKITGTGNIMVSNSPSGGGSLGTLVLANAANNFAGDIHMAANSSGGVLLAGVSGNSGVPSTSGLYYNMANHGGFFDLNGCNVTINALSSVSGAGGYITNSGASGVNTLTVNQTSTQSFGLAINDGPNAKTALTKSGSGSLTLKATPSNYTGPTLVSAGSLFVNGSGSLAAGSAVTVNSNTTIGGTGAANGTLSLSGTVSPGTTGAGAIGTFSTGAETWNSGASYYFDIANVSGTAGTNWDLVSSSGNVNLSAGSYTITVNGASLAGFSNITAYTWKIISAASFTGFNASNFTINTVNFPAFTGSFKVTQPNSTEVDLVYVPVGGLAVNPGNLSFTGAYSTITGTASASQSYILTGSSLDGSNITVTAPAGYEISLDNSSFSSSQTLVNGSNGYTSPTLNTTIYVRIAASALPTASLTGNVGNVGGNAANINVALTGVVYAIAPTQQATNVTFSNVSYNSFTVSWTNGNGASRIVAIWPTSVDVAVAPANYTNYTANTVFGSGSTTGGGNYVVYNGNGNSVNVTGLSLNTNYAVEVYEYNGGTSVEAYNTAPATGNPNNATTLQGVYYWNGASPSNGTNLTANGGTGTWNTTGTNYSWVEPITPGGNGVAWANGSNKAVIAGTAGTITQGSNITAGSITVQVDGYTLQNGGATQTITAPVYIGNSSNTAVNLTVNPGTYTTEFLGNVAPAAGTTGGALTLAGTSSAGYGEIELGNNDVISLPLTISNTGTTEFGLASTSGGSASVTGPVTLAQQIGAGNIFLAGTGTNGLLTISGPITGTGSILLATGASGSHGTLQLAPTTANQNTFNGNIYMAASYTTPYGTLKTGINGISGIPSTAQLFYNVSGDGGIFDLNGCNTQIAGLSSVTGAVGIITNDGASGTNTLTVNQSTTTSFGLIIQDGSNAKTALASTGSGSLTLSAINTFSGGLSVGGTGTLTLSAANTFTGGVTLNGGTLDLGVPNAVAAGNNFTFAGGELNDGGFNQAALASPLGTLTLTANSTIQLGAASHYIYFANSSGTTWTGTAKLTITGWTGTEGTSGNTGHIYVGNNGSGLTLGQLAQISFTGYGDGASILSTGEIVPSNNWTWVGTTSAWNVGSNWNKNSVPSICSDNIYIPAATPNSPSLTTGAVNVGSVTIDANATLNIANGSSLSVCGNWVGGTSANANVTGTVIMTGASVSGYTQFGTLTVNNSSGVTINSNASVSVTKALVNQQGNITNNGTVTIMSTASGDAYYDDFSNGSAGSFIGNMIVQRYISDVYNGYRDLSSPVSGTVANMSSPQSLFGANGVKCWYAYNPYPNLQVYNESENIVNGAYYEGWLSYTGTSNPLTPMQGMAFRTYVGNPYTISFTGAPFTGTQSIGITKTPPATRTAEGWNFVGNPYPSSVSWNAFKAGNSGVTTAAYYVFNTSAEYSGNWGAWNGTAGTNGATDNIAVGQGFFVSAAGSSSIHMTNSMRSATPGTFFGPNHALDNEVRLVLSGNGNSDEVVSYTDPDATSGYDPNYDAVKIPAGSTVNISFALSGMDYAINVMDSLSASSVLPLDITVADTGAFTLTATTLNIPGLKAYLSDAQSGTLTDLSANSPTLSLNGGQAYSGRYSVVFKAEAVSGISQLDDQSTHIYSYGNTVYIHRSSLNRATVTVTDILGREIAEVPASGELTTVELNGPEEWYAIVKVTEGSNVSVAKVLISNK